MAKSQPNKKKGQHRKRITTRVAVLFLLVGVLLTVVLTRVAIIVIQNNDEYSHRALAQMTSSGTTLVAAPGDILDSNGVVLATSYKVYILILDGKVLKETEELYPGSMDKTIEIASQAFSIDEESLREAFINNENSAYYRFPTVTVDEDGNTVSTKTVLSQEQVDAYNAAVEAFNEEKTAHNAVVAGENPEGLTAIVARVAGIWFEDEYRREYPLNELLSKVIGYTTQDTTEGLNGLEYTYNSEINGTNGKEYAYINSDGHVVNEVIPAENGYTLNTSLDANVAQIIQESIEEFREESDGNRINVLVMNPNTGEIVAMVSDTDYDLNNPQDLTGLFTEEELANPASTFLLQEAYQNQMDELLAMDVTQQTSALLQQVQRNFMVSNAFEPGSTAKTFTLAAAVEEQVISENTRFYCGGGLQLGGYYIRCHNRDGCGSLNPIEAFGASCNVSFMDIGEKLGAETFSQYQEIFNFGQRTGIDLPGEANTSRLLYTAAQLKETELATNAFGQGYSVTMVQLAAAFSSIVNGGTYYAPHVVTSIEDGDGNVIRKIDPSAVRTTISKDTSDFLKEALVYVTEEGTAAGFNQNGYIFMGKTGGAEKLPRGTGKYIVSFIGAAPVDNPQFLVYTTIDEPHEEDQSSSVPARVLTQIILKKLYSYYNIYPEDGIDAYGYDWDALRKNLDTNDAFGGESFINDPGNTFPWLELPETSEAEGETSSEENPEASVENPEASAENPEAPAENPEDVTNPEEAPVDVPVENPEEVVTNPEEVPVEQPVEAPVEEPVEAPVEQPVEAPVENPVAGE